jgi:Flp pilus assembly protein CpaB
VHRPPPSRRFDLGLALRRRPRHRRALVVLLAVLVGVATMGVVQQAEDAAAAWGEGVPVLVAIRDLRPGDRLDPGTVRVRTRPRATVPDGALTELPADRRAAEAIYAGEVVRAERLAPSGLSALAARLPAGTRAIAVPVDAGTLPPLEVGDRVDVLVALPSDVAGDGPPGFPIATSAPVVDVSETAVTVAVRADDATRIAVALGAGAVTLALTADPS